jgi:hypothetical protein
MMYLRQRSTRLSYQGTTLTPSIEPAPENLVYTPNKTGIVCIAYFSPHILDLLYQFNVIDIHKVRHLEKNVISVRQYVISWYG